MWDRESTWDYLKIPRHCSVFAIKIKIIAVSLINLTECTCNHVILKSNT